MPVGELLARVTSSELAEWQAFERQYGRIGQERDDLLMAMLASLMANLQRDQKKQRQPYTTEQFLPKWAPKPRKSPEEQAQMLKALTVAFGGEVR